MPRHLRQLVLAPHHCTCGAQIWLKKARTCGCVRACVCARVHVHTSSHSHSGGAEISPQGAHAPPQTRRRNKRRRGASDGPECGVKSWDAWCLLFCHGPLLRCCPALDILGLWACLDVCAVLSHGHGAVHHDLSSTCSSFSHIRQLSSRFEIALINTQRRQGPSCPP